MMGVSAVNSRPFEVGDTHYCLRWIVLEIKSARLPSIDAESVSRPSVDALEMNYGQVCWYLEMNLEMNAQCGYSEAV